MCLCEQARQLVPPLGTPEVGVGLGRVVWGEGEQAGGSVDFVGELDEAIAPEEGEGQTATGLGGRARSTDGRCTMVEEGRYQPSSLALQKRELGRVARGWNGLSDNLSCCCRWRRMRRRGRGVEGYRRPRWHRQSHCRCGHACFAPCWAASKPRGEEKWIGWGLRSGRLRRLNRGQCRRRGVCETRR